MNLLEILRANGLNISIGGLLPKGRCRSFTRSPTSRWRLMGVWAKRFLEPTTSPRWVGRWVARIQPISARTSPRRLVAWLLDAFVVAHGDSLR